MVLSSTQLVRWISWLVESGRAATDGTERPLSLSGAVSSYDDEVSDPATRPRAGRVRSGDVEPGPRRRERERVGGQATVRLRARAP